MSHQCKQAALFGVPVVSFSWAIQSLVHQTSLPCSEFELYSNRNSSANNRKWPPMDGDVAIWDSRPRFSNGKAFYSRFYQKADTPGYNGPPGHGAKPFEVGECVKILPNANDEPILARITAAWQDEDGSQCLEYDSLIVCDSETSATGIIVSHGNVKSKISCIFDRILVLRKRDWDARKFATESLGFRGDIYYWADGDGRLSDDDDDDDEYDSDGMDLDQNVTTDDNDVMQISQAF